MIIEALAYIGVLAMGVGMLALPLWFISHHTKSKDIHSKDPYSHQDWAGWHE